MNTINPGAGAPEPSNGRALTASPLSPRQCRTVAAEVASDLVILTFDEWSSIRISLRGLVHAAVREGRAIEFDTESAETAEAVERRRNADVWSCLDAAALHDPDRVTFALEVRPDATDAELLIAARRALTSASDSGTR